LRVIERDKLSDDGQLAIGSPANAASNPFWFHPFRAAYPLLTSGGLIWKEELMPHVQSTMFTILSLFLSATPMALAADAPSDGQLERLMEMASETPDRPDHDYVTSSLQALSRQSQDLKLSQEQREKIKTIVDQYERTRRDRETAYKRSEMDALKLIHDSRSSLFSIETAVQKADQEHSKLRMAGIKALREARDVLRPEQYTQWRQGHAAKQLAQGSPHQERGEQYDSDSGDAGRIAPH
jgi:Spy/CpxP family protein refolding chaperone